MMIHLEDNEQIADMGKYTSLISERVIESANLLTVEKEEKIEMNQDDSTLFISDRTEHIKMPNDDRNESGSGEIVEVVNIESIQDNEIKAKDIFIKTAKQLTHIEDSVEATTFVDHDETDVDEKVKVDLQVTGKENTSGPTEDAEKWCTNDIKEIEGKGDELKSKRQI